MVNVVLSLGMKWLKHETDNFPSSVVHPALRIDLVIL
jgi:hypothetical protein